MFLSFDDEIELESYETIRFRNFFVTFILLALLFELLNSFLLIDDPIHMLYLSEPLEPYFILLIFVFC